MVAAAEPTTFPRPSADLSVLLLGAGGREHALAFKLAQSPRVARVFVAPGNAGTALIGGGKVKNVDVPYGGSAGYEGAAAWAKEQGVDLVVPGPEQPLVDGAEAVFRKGESRVSRACMCAYARMPAPLTTLKASPAATVH